MSGRVVAKKIVKDRDGAYFILVLESGREIVVSGKTWEEKKVGDVLR